MDDVSLELENREVTGKAVKRLRKQGLVPAVIHDHGKDSTIVQADYQTVQKVYSKAGKHHPVSLKAGQRNYMALIKNITFDPKKNTITHVVFNAVKANEKVETQIPIHMRLEEGNDATPAERAGLIVLNQVEVVEVSAFPKDLPDVLVFNGEKLVEVGDHATIADLSVPDGVEIKAEPAQTIATVFEPSALQAANEDAGGTAEEVVEEAGEEPAEGVEPAENAAEETEKKEET